MGRWLFSTSARARRFLEEADSRVGFDLIDLMRRGPADRLTATEHAQVAVFVTNAAATYVLLETGVVPAVAAGHSVGELNALAASGALTVEEALGAVIERGALFGQAPRVGAMATIIGLPRQQLDELCTSEYPGRDVVVGLDNSPTCVVISGEAGAVDRCARRALATGATRVVKLNTSNSFHSPVMSTVVDAWREVVERLDIREPSIPVALNATGKMTRDPGAIRNAMVAQVAAPVNWRQCLIEASTCIGVDAFVECGDSTSLTLFCRQTLPAARCVAMHTRAGLGELQRLQAR